MFYIINPKPKEECLMADIKEETPGACVHLAALLNLFQNEQQLMNSILKHLFCMFFSVQYSTSVFRSKWQTKSQPIK